ncbi:MAG: hypothetical protein AAFV88_11315, partial [Planctomycetota bacterium]
GANFVPKRLLSYRAPQKMRKKMALGLAPRTTLPIHDFPVDSKPVGKPAGKVLSPHSGPMRGTKVEQSATTPTSYQPRRAVGESLLLLVLLACLGCGQADSTKPVEPPPEIAELSFAEQVALGRAGDRKRIECDLPVTASHLTEVFEKPEQETWLRDLILDGGTVGDEACEVIAQLPALRHLRLRQSPITDVGLAKLAECESLQILNLPHAGSSSGTGTASDGSLTNEGLAVLATLPDLRLLRLGGGDLDAESADVIAELKSLRQLHLIGVPIDDRGLRKLASLPKLQSLYLDDAAVTESGWDWLFAEHPQLHVHVNHQHVDRDPNHADHSHD